VGVVVIWRTGRHVAGRLLVFIGLVHLSGLWVGRYAARRAIAAGLVNQADSAIGRLAAKTDQEALFWFVLWGLMTILIGQLLIFLEDAGRRPPRWFAWQFFALNASCALLMPKGGFWWVFVPVFLLLRAR
jgi:hypothetical protein